jgi:hypothetical protein
MARLVLFATSVSVAAGVGGWPMLSLGFDKVAIKGSAATCSGDLWIPAYLGGTSSKQSTKPLGST